jgi:hypothetical protein
LSGYIFGATPCRCTPCVSGFGRQLGYGLPSLIKMLATTIGTNMMQFSQVVAPQGGAAGLTGNKTSLSTKKGLDQNQIEKLKDECGIRNAQQIPPIWLMSQASKGKSFNTYHAHLTKSINAWCCLHHIDRNKSIFLKAKFFKDLVALQFNPGGAVTQFQSVMQGMLMLACCSLMVVELNIVGTTRKQRLAPPTHAALRTFSSKLREDSCTSRKLHGPQVEHRYLLRATLVYFGGPLRLLQGAPQDLQHPRLQGMLHHQACLHKRGVQTDYVGNCGWRALILWVKSCCVRLCSGNDVQLLCLLP